MCFNFNDFWIFLNTTFVLTYVWVFFFKLNSNSILKNSTNTNICNTKNNSNGFFVILYFLTSIYILIYIITIRGKVSTLWFNHIILNNFTIYLYMLFIVLSFFIFILVNILFKKSNLFKSIDYLFSISNLMVILPFLFFVNTFFTFLFLLELISTILLYKLISSKIWFKNSNSKITLNNNIPHNFINMVFFQYWVTFFSTIFIVYFYINIYKLYGTSDFYIIQFICSSNNHYHNNMESFNSRILAWTFLMSVLFKLGITPLHLFKVEVYKGLPFISIFFYTVYYFTIFFIIFIFFLNDFLFFLLPQYYLLLVLIILIGIIYVIILLFDVTFLKVFFTYSTIINSIAFLIAFISCL